MSDPFDGATPIGGTTTAAAPKETRYERFVRDPMETAIAHFLTRETQNPFQINDPRKPIEPGPISKGIAHVVTPQTPTGAAIDAASMLMPGVGLLGRLGIATGAGALGGLAEGKPGAGALKGLGSQAGGELLTAGLRKAGRFFGENAYLRSRARDFGAYLEKHLPALAGTLKTAKDLFTTFTIPKGKAIVGQELDKARSDAIRASLGRPFWTPQFDQAGKVRWVQVPFRVADKNLSDLYNRGYDLTGDPRGMISAKQYRQVANMAKNRLIGDLKGVNMSVGQEYELARRRFAITSDLTELFKDPKAFLPNGELNVPGLKTLFQGKVHNPRFGYSMGQQDFEGLLKSLGGGELTPAVGKAGVKGSLRVHGFVLPSYHPPQVMMPAGKLPVYLNPPAGPATAAVSRVLNPQEDEE